MPGIESFYNKKKKGAIKAIPIDIQGARDAKEASDAELNDFIREEIIPNIGPEHAVNDLATFTGMPQGGLKHKYTGYPLSDEEGTEWVITSQQVITRVYHLREDEPDTAVHKVRTWEEHGEGDMHTFERQDDWLTRQVIGIPVAPNEQVVAASEYKTYTSGKSAKQKKELIDPRTAEELRSALDEIIRRGKEGGSGAGEGE